MSTCTTCARKETRSRPLMSDNTCNECTLIKENDECSECALTVCDKVSDTPIIISKESIEVLNRSSEYIVNNIHTQTDNESLAQNDFKDSLLASLYSQVEFLRGEIQERNQVIRSLMSGDREVYRDPHGEGTSVCSENISLPDISSPNVTNETLDLSSDDLRDSITSQQIDDAELVKQNHLKNEIEIIRKEKHEKYLISKKDKLRAHNILDRGITISNNNESPLGNEGFMQSAKQSNGDTETIDDTSKYKINHIYEKPLVNEATWRSGTTLIVGDSLLNGIEESKLRNAKVRVFPGSSIEDLVYHLTPLLRKKPSNVIIHIGTNNCVRDTARDITEKLENLKLFVQDQTQDCKIIFSSLIKRSDNAYAQLTVNSVNEQLKHLGTDIMDNNNINWIHLGRKGHHLTPHGTGKLAMNIIKKLKSL